jgi:hypothetical protein
LLTIDCRHLIQRYALARHQFADDLTLVGTLSVYCQVLQITATAVAKMSTRWLYSLRRGSDQGFYVRFIKALTGDVHRHFDLLTRQRLVDKDGFARRVMAHATPVMS